MRTVAYLLGEKYLIADAYHDSNDVSDGLSLFCGHSYDICRWTCSHLYSIQDTQGYADAFHFGSAHASGLNLSFCDGSVQHISYSIERAIHVLLGGRHDGQVIDGREF